MTDGRLSAWGVVLVGLLLVGCSGTDDPFAGDAGSVDRRPDERAADAGAAERDDRPATLDLVSVADGTRVDAAASGSDAAADGVGRQCVADPDCALVDDC